MGPGKDPRYAGTIEQGAAGPVKIGQSPQKQEKIEVEPIHE